MQVVAVLYGLFAAFLALVGSFADGDDTFARLLLTLLHPLSAVGLLAVVFMPSLGKPALAAAATLLLATALADGYYALSIATGSTKGDWEIPAILAVVPLLGLLYTAYLLTMGRPAADSSP